MATDESNLVSTVEAQVRLLSVRRFHDLEAPTDSIRGSRRLII